MNEAEFAQQQIALGRRIHTHEGVFWEEVYPFYCKPAFEFRALHPRESKPKFLKSLLGYSHQVLNPADGNRTVSYMVLSGDDLQGFDLSRLNTKKRNQVRKGLKSCEIIQMTSVDEYLDTMRDINMSQAKRQMRLDVPADYYIENEAKWRREIQLNFAHTGHKWFGAYHNNALVAYLVMLHVEDVFFFQAVKSHSDFLNLCPTDALYFTVLDRIRRENSSAMVINGGPARPSLDHFKEQFLFKATEFPYYSSRSHLFMLAKTARSLGQNFLLAVKQKALRKRDVDHNL